MRTINPGHSAAGSTQSALERLEPYAGKLARTVLRGAGARKGPWPTRRRQPSKESVEPTSV
jgi:hypothetical protein